MKTQNIGEKAITIDSLRGQHVVVVGGSSGLGKAVAEATLRSAGRVTLVARDAGKLQRACDELRHLGEVSQAALDMTDESGINAWFARQGNAAIHHLVITAASTSHGSFGAATLAEVRQSFESKFMGPYAVAKAALPKIADGGSITFFSGVLSRRPGLNCSALGAVNSAIEGLTRALALELGPGVRVNCCSPGMVRSEAYAGMEPAQREAMFEATGASLPLRRVGQPHEIAQAVLLMMTNTYMTGHVLDVDGGHMVRQYAQS